MFKFRPKNVNLSIKIHIVVNIQFTSPLKKKKKKYIQRISRRYQSSCKQNGGCLNSIGSDPPSYSWCTLNIKFFKC